MSRRSLLDRLPPVPTRLQRLGYVALIAVAIWISVWLGVATTTPWGWLPVLVVGSLAGTVVVNEKVLSSKLGIGGYVVLWTVTPLSLFLFNVMLFVVFMGGAVGGLSWFLFRMTYRR